MPLQAGVTYIVVGRHPLDMAVSLYHHSNNIDRRRMAELTGRPEAVRPPRPPLHEWLVGFVDWEGDPRQWLDTLPGVMLHLSDAWARRHEPNIVLVHYDDLVTDLDGTMRRIAGLLGIPVDEDVGPPWCTPPPSTPCVPDAAAPDTLGVLKDRPPSSARAGRAKGGRS